MIRLIPGFGSHRSKLAFYVSGDEPVSVFEITDNQVQVIGDLIGWGAVIDATSLIYLRDEELLRLVDGVPELSDIAAWAIKELII
jgi:hypothetical protein